MPLRLQSKSVAQEDTLTKRIHKEISLTAPDEDLLLSTRLASGIFFCGYYLRVSSKMRILNTILLELDSFWLKIIIMKQQKRNFACIIPILVSALPRLGAASLE